ncbi:hypothetical protein ACFV0L_41280 [Streptosporangium canum]|uniref:hypothetical protein n=1 Tax=Streptosporangium canum TaxID=324952 RepID=UPI0036B7335D
MSNTGDKEDGGAILPFPRVVLPSFGALDPEVKPSGQAGPAEQSVEAAWPHLPQIAPMRPPLHLTVPGTPTPEPASGDGEEGAFVPPAPADPDNPTASEVAATAMALVTALGVAAAQGMWHRARQRQALADQSRAAADKAGAKAAAAGPGAQAARGARGGGTSGRSGGSVGSSLLSPGGDKKGSKSKGSRAFARRTGDGAGGSGPDKAGKGARGPFKRQADDKAERGPKGRKDARGGKDRAEPKRAKGGPGKNRGGWLRRATGTTGPGGKPKQPKQPKDGPKRRASDDKKKGPKGSGDSRGRKLTWKAPKAPKGGADKGGKGGGKGGGKPKRWSGRTGTGGKETPGSTGPKRPARSWARKVIWANSATWWKRWRSRRAKSGDQADPTFAETAAQKSATPNDSPRTDPDPGEYGQADRDGQARTQGKTPPPPPPPPGWERMRPPPAADRTVKVTVERVDERPWPRPEAAALTVGQAALPAGPTGSPTAGPAAPTPSAPHPQGDRPVSTPARMTTTQYADADLTIYDVIDADADMAEEITAGVDDARATADGCERLMTKLEAVAAEIVELKVPGVLAGMLLRLIDKTLTVKARAEAIAANLPAAAEAISTAGSNAEMRHKSLADAVRDAGHIRPAEREYHDE